MANVRDRFVDAGGLLGSKFAERSLRNGSDAKQRIV
jgi:hypothetical protein